MLKNLYHSIVLLGLSIICSSIAVQAQAPTITSFTPTSGAGGTRVTITGTNFTGATSLTIGGQPVHSYWVSSATTIVAVVGTGATGAIEVRSTTGVGNSSVPMTNNFTVTGPGVFGNPISTVATLVLGQSDFTTQTLVGTNLAFPFSVAVDPTTGKIFVADRQNHRIFRYASYAALSNGIAPEGVLGQADFTSISANPGGVSATTANQPYGVYVDGGGRLWVADAINNRVLRYDNAANKANGAPADGVLGQVNFTSNTANPGGVSASTVRVPYGVYVDGGGRLWLADDNSRILRYDNAANKANGAPADGVLGQANFTSNGPNPGGVSATTASQPYGVYVDGGGRLWVADYSNHRILRYDNAANKANGAPADGVLCQANFTSNTANPGGVSATTASLPFGVFVDGSGRLWVTDQNNHRVLRFDNAANKANGSPADGVIGQPMFTTNISNNGGRSASSLHSTRGLHIDNTGKLWVADGLNSRVLMYEFIPPPIPTIISFAPTSGAGGQQVTITGTNFTGATSVTIGGQPVHNFWVSSATTIVAVVGSGTTGPIEVRTTNGTGTSGTNFTVTGAGIFTNPISTVATLVLGQTTFATATSGVANMTQPYSIAVDPTSGKIFVADRGNNRVLRYASYSALSNGNAPEGVLGQVDFSSNNPNRGPNQATIGSPTASTLHRPHGVFVDGSGRLWVTDRGNNRILRFDNAANKANGVAADGVLSQLNFTSNLGGASATTANNPAGVYVDGGGRLWVADEDNSRILRFDNAANKANGAAADGVLGQINLSSSAVNPGGVSATTANRPTGVCVDGGGRLWVVDGLNNRVLRYDNAANKPNGAPADRVLGQEDFASNAENQGNANNPSASTLRVAYSAFVDGAGRLWVADAVNHRILRYDNAVNKPNGAAADGVIGQSSFTTRTAGVSASSLTAPASLYIDNAGRLWITEVNNNRVLMFGEGVPQIQNPVITSISPATTSATAQVFTVTFSGTNLTTPTSLTVSQLNSSGVTVASLQLINFVLSSSATQAVVSIPSGAVVTQGSYTFTYATVGGSASTTLTVTPAPAPVQLAPTQIARYGFDANWQTNLSTGYLVEVSTVNNFATTVAAVQLGANATTTTISGLTEKATYFVRIVGLGNSNERLNTSNTQEVRTMKVATSEYFTYTPNVFSFGRSRFTVSWDDAGNELEYQVQVFTNAADPDGSLVAGFNPPFTDGDGNTQFGVQLPANTTSYTYSGLSTSLQWYFRVRARFNPWGEWSQTVPVINYQIAQTTSDGEQDGNALLMTDNIDNIPIGQSFTTLTAGLITQVQVQTGRFDIPQNGNVRLRLIQLTSNPPTNGNQTVIYEQSGFSMSGANTWQTFNLSTAASVSATSTYALEVFAVGAPQTPGQSNWLRIKKTTNPYSGGIAFYNTPVDAYPNDDLAFRVTIVEPAAITTATPNPIVATMGSVNVTFSGGAFFATTASMSVLNVAGTTVGSFSLTPFISSSTPLDVSIAIPAGYLATAGNISVTIGGYLGNAVTTLTISPAIPQIISLSYQTTAANVAASAISVVGSGFAGLNVNTVVTLSTLSAGGVENGFITLPITVNNAGSLVATIPAGAFSTAGTVRLTVNNVTGTATFANITIVPPPPSISSVVPGLVQATSAGLNITLHGNAMQNATSLTIGQLNSSGVQIGILNLLPFTSGTTPSTSLTIALPAGTVATGGTLTISLSNALGTTTAELLVQSDNIIVTNANNDGGGSLRRAFALTSTGGTIQIQGSIDPITLTGGPIEVNKDIRLIDNNGGLEINGNGNPVFDVQCGGNLYLENVILTGSGNQPAIQNNCGTVIMRRSRATGN